MDWPKVTNPQDWWDNFIHTTDQHTDVGPFNSHSEALTWVFNTNEYIFAHELSEGKKIVYEGTYSTLCNKLYLRNVTLVTL